MCEHPGCRTRVPVREHWLCRTHRRERGRAFVAAEGTAVTEAAVLGALVFSFGACELDGFLARFYAVIRCGQQRRSVRGVLAQHSLLGKVSVKLGIARDEMAELLVRFIAFATSHAAAFGWAELPRSCATVVRRWYPTLVASVPLGAVLRAERLLALVHASVGEKPYLALADLALALRGVLTRDAVECVFIRYIALLGGDNAASALLRFRLRPSAPPR
jgi:hypothetical protein